MDVTIPAVRRRAQCAAWLASRCNYGEGCRCRAAADTDAAAEKDRAVIPPARRSSRPAAQPTT